MSAAICYAAATAPEFRVKLMPYRIARLAAVFAVPLLVAACGVKGPLESPIQAQLDAEKRATAQPLPQPETPAYGAQTRAGAGRNLPRNQSTTGAGTGSGYVVNTPAARQPSALDWLIN